MSPSLLFSSFGCKRSNRNSQRADQARGSAALALASACAGWSLAGADDSCQLGGTFPQALVYLCNKRLRPTSWTGRVPGARCSPSGVLLLLPWARLPPPEDPLLLGRVLPGLLLDASGPCTGTVSAAVP